MGKKVTPDEARALGARIQKARKQARLTLAAAAADVPMHHSQVLRVEGGDFKTLSDNVRKLCKSLQISDLPGDTAPGSRGSLEVRFHALLSAVPGSAAAFASLFDVLERPPRRRRSAAGRGKH